MKEFSTQAIEGALRDAGSTTKVNREPRHAPGSTTRALRGGASVDGTAPALRGGASVLRVRCSCATEQEFVQRYAADICARGMFLRTGLQLPVGSRVRFELLLRSGRCALGGVGRVSWQRAADPALGRCAGGAVAFERLRRGDRAVIERMDLARGPRPSRFEQPDLQPEHTVDAPRGAELAKLLFADLGARADAEPGASAFLSEDLSAELGDGGWRHAGRPGGELVPDLADQLEPGAEPARDDEPSEEFEVDVEIVPPRASQPPDPARSTVRPAPMADRPRSARALRARLPQRYHSSSIQSVPAPAPTSGGAASQTVQQAPEPVVTRAQVEAAARAPAPVPASAAAPDAPAPVRTPARPPALTPSPARAPAALPRQPRRAAEPSPGSSPAPGHPPALAAAPELQPAPAALRARRASTLSLVVLLSAVIIVSCAVTYLALTDQLPPSLSFFNR